ncbi:MAG TPA: hypothetical protein PLI53_08995, partial [Geobacteraceae bacterium]|nr:hypothetical protein [Geobacteraceae bacterium]
FKKTHHIGAVLLRAAATNDETPSAAPAPEVPPAEVPVPPESPAIPAVDDAAAPVLQELEVPEPQETPFEGFELDLPDSSQDETKDLDFTDFSFSDELPSPSSGSMTDEEDDFSFEEPAVEDQADENRDFDLDEAASGMENYERILEPDSIADIGGAVEEDTPNDTEDEDYFGTSNFAFAPESEDIFNMESETTPEPTDAKKAQPNLDDFEKEFDMIFDIDDSGDTEEKTS